MVAVLHLSGCDLPEGESQQAEVTPSPVPTATPTPTLKVAAKEFVTIYNQKLIEYSMPDAERAETVSLGPKEATYRIRDGVQAIGSVLPDGRFSKMVFYITPPRKVPAISTSERMWQVNADEIGALAKWIFIGNIRKEPVYFFHLEDQDLTSHRIEEERNGVKLIGGPGKRGEYLITVLPGKEDAW